MNREDIIRMARKAGWSFMEAGMDAQRLEHFAALVAAAEREEILTYAKSEAFNRMHGERSPYAYELVNYIRARGQTP